MYCRRHVINDQDAVPKSLKPGRCIFKRNGHSALLARSGRFVVRPSYFEFGILQVRCLYSSSYLFTVFDKMTFFFRYRLSQVLLTTLTISFAVSVIARNGFQSICAPSCIRQCTGHKSEVNTHESATGCMLSPLAICYAIVSPLHCHG